MVIVLDVLNPDNEPEKRKSEKPQRDPRSFLDSTRRVRKQVISITGEVVEVEH